LIVVLILGLFSCRMWYCGCYIYCYCNLLPK